MRQGPGFLQNLLQQDKQVEGEGDLVPPQEPAPLGTRLKPELRVNRRDFIQPWAGKAAAVPEHPLLLSGAAGTGWEVRTRPR